MKKTLAFLLGLAIATPMFASEVAEPEANPAPQSKVSELLAKMPKVSGYLQTGLNWNKKEGGKSSSSFEAKRLRLMVDGNVAKNLTFRLQIEAFNNTQSKAVNGQRNLQVMDAFATWAVKPSFKIRAGQFYTPMGFENYDISPATLETVNFSDICYLMECRNAINQDYTDYGRDLGIMVFGDVLPSEEGFNYLSYNVALTNGAEQMKNDDNASKDIIVAITGRPVKHLMIKGSYNWGEYGPSYQPMTRFIVGAWYNNPTGLDLRAEYGMLSAKNGGADIVKEKGAYVLAGWHAGKWLPVVRWDMYKDDVNKASANNYNAILAGVSYEVTKSFKLQANYIHKMYSDDAKAALGYDSMNQVFLMSIFKF